MRFADVLLYRTTCFYFRHVDAFLFVEQTVVKLRTVSAAKDRLCVLASREGNAGKLKKNG